MRNISFLLTLSIVLTGWSAQAQKFLEGQILHKDQTPAAAATVEVVGKKYLAIADSLGRYRIQVPESYPYTLRVSSVGYKPVEQQVTSDPGANLAFNLVEVGDIVEVVITSRRRSEAAQDVPIAISIVTGRQLDETGSFNVNRIKEFVPTVQFYSSNPRNTTLNIRGLGSTFGLTNDGIDPGVGFYIDGVYYARPAATAMDFIDIDQVEVLRGPQGTLFGKNTTAGAFNITT
ncbi:MAG: TonB-dependent receptor, partial [Chitinophagaceae bacterium]|nr:TonB-dependent receptor [Chitinophagaceae bacterium]